MRVDTSVVPFGNRGSFEFRTREDEGRLMMLQMLSGTQQTVAGNIEFLIFGSQLQVVSRFGTGGSAL
jgi:hypothetical protein